MRLSLATAHTASDSALASAPPRLDTSVPTSERTSAAPAPGTPKVPVEGFGALKGSSGPKMFTLQKVQWDLTRLPQAATCFNTLYLPPYQTEDQLKEKLEFAVTEASEGFGLK